jgi:hypothetical protein
MSLKKVHSFDNSKGTARLNVCFSSDVSELNFDLILSKLNAFRGEMPRQIERINLKVQ